MKMAQKAPQLAVAPTPHQHPQQDYYGSRGNAWLLRAAQVPSGQGAAPPPYYAPPRNDAPLWPLTPAPMQYLKRLMGADSPWYLPPHMSTTETARQFYADAMNAIVHPDCSSRDVALSYASWYYAACKAAYKTAVHLELRGVTQHLCELSLWPTQPGAQQDAPPIRKPLQADLTGDTPVLSLEGAAGAVPNIRSWSPVLVAGLAKANLADVLAEAKRCLAVQASSSAIAGYLMDRRKRLQLALVSYRSAFGDNAPLVLAAEALLSRNLETMLQDALRSNDAHLWLTAASGTLVSDQDVPQPPLPTKTCMNIQMPRMADRIVFRGNGGAVRPSRFVRARPSEDAPQCSSPSRAFSPSAYSPIDDRGGGGFSPVVAIAEPMEPTPAQPAGLVSIHGKVALHHNAVLCLATLRAAVEDVQAAIEYQLANCRYTRLWLTVAAALAKHEREEGVSERRVVVEEAERQRGDHNRIIGALCEDSMFQFSDGGASTPEEDQLVALMLASVERSPHNRRVTRIGGVPSMECTAEWSTVEPPHVYADPTTVEVHAWGAWLRGCLRTARTCDSGRGVIANGPEWRQFVADCRRDNRPAFALLKSVRVGDGRAVAGELDLVLYDAVSQQVLVVGEIKAMSTDLISARRQREKFVKLLKREAQRVHDVVAAGGDPTPIDGVVGVLLTCEGEAKNATTRLLNANSFDYFCEHPVYRWIMISAFEIPRAGTRCCGRISWKLIREVGLLIGRGAVEADVGEPALNSPDAVATAATTAIRDDASLDRITAAMRSIWYKGPAKEGYESPHTLLKESSDIRFTNLLLVKKQSYT
jgi:hypothetical protein